MEQPPFFSFTGNRSPGGPGCLRTRSILLRSQGREEVPAAAAAARVWTRNAPFTSSMGRCQWDVVNGTLFSPVAGERERQPPLPVQGKERDLYGERNLLQLSGKKNQQSLWALLKRKWTLPSALVKGWDGGTSKVGL